MKMALQMPGPSAIIISITLESLLAIHLLSSKKILDKNIQAKYLDIGRNQTSVIAFQVEYLVLISPIKMVILVVSKYKNRRNEGHFAELHLTESHCELCNKTNLLSQIDYEI